LNDGNGLLLPLPLLLLLLLLLLVPLPPLANVFAPVKRPNTWAAAGFEDVVSMPRMIELPIKESEGAPAGVKLLADDGGGGPAGVVDGFSP